MDKPRIADMKDPVIVWDCYRGMYWREDGKGYTGAAEMAGIWERADAPKGDKGRKIEHLKVPEGHIRHVEEKLLDARRRIADLEQALMVSEEYRVAYEKGKNELYAMGGEICEAVAKHLPCGEGPLNRYTRKIEREHSPQLLQQNKELCERIAELEADRDRWRVIAEEAQIAAQRQKEGE